MAELLTSTQAAEEARGCFTDGRNCAESVLVALSGCPGVPEMPDGIGSGFTSGIGKTGCVCGALAAGVMSLSAWVDTQGLEPMAQRERAEELSAEFTRRFTERWGATCCRVIERGMEEGSNEAAAHCASITEFSAGLVAEMIAEAGSAGRAWAARDVAEAVRRGALDVGAGLAVGLAVGAVWPPAAAASVIVAMLGSLLMALVAEPGAPAARRAGRGLRVAGLASAALLAVVAVVAPGAVADAVGTGLLGASAGAATARVMLSLALLVIAGLAVYELRRFR
ncbi:MAG: C-GCAxxG-C-C family protein [Anaerosomatales bacterium]|nr:C-GCAxxG-C-C family protein [Anaerosomatales bacterium]